jgi:glucose-6-phosphate 1-epimerase
MTLTESILTLAAGDGAKARVHMEGGHLLSWIPAGETEDRLFVSAKSGFGKGVSIRGGVPVCFPQFGADGALAGSHGFARTSTWTLVDEAEGHDGARATLQLTESDATRALWPHAFTAELRIALAGAELAMLLVVRNTDVAPFTFTGALHPYFRTHDAYGCTVEGLRATRYRDALRGNGVMAGTAAPLRIDGEIDRVYFDEPGPVTVRDGDRTLSIVREGFPDVVVWNPGEAGVARKGDMHTGDERRMLCVEPAVVGAPVTLAPGARWAGAMIVTAG